MPPAQAGDSHIVIDMYVTAAMIAMETAMPCAASPQPHLYMHKQDSRQLACVSTAMLTLCNTYALICAMALRTAASLS